LIHEIGFGGQHGDLMQLDAVPQIGTTADLSGYYRHKSSVLLQM
jgi:hypothetical protein